MEISEFIKLLEEVRDKFGEIHVFGYDSEYAPVINTTFAESHKYVEIERE